MKKMKLSTKLLVAFLLVGALPAAIIGFLALNKASNALEEQAFNQLIGMRDIKKLQIENYFEEALVNMETFGRSKDVAELFEELVTYHHDMNTAPDGSYDVSTERYKKIWADYGKNVTQFQHDSGFHDIFMICAAHGHVMYTAAKECDIGTNLKHGQYKNSGLAKILHKIVAARGRAVVDFEPYAPSNDEPAAFAGAPIWVDGELKGAMVVQLSTDKINHIMQQRSGMGQTGETYLVGQDKLMRSDSFLDPTGHSVEASFAGTVAANGCDTEAATEALAGRTDAKIIADYNGNPVLSAYMPVEFYGLKWALLAEIDESEAFETKNAIALMITVVLIIAIVTVVTVAILITRSIILPINRIIADLTEGSEQVASASGQVSSASQSLAEGATEQAAGLEETSSSLEEMASMTKQNADNAQQANTLASDARKAADTGNQSMGRMNDAIVEIQKSSDETAKIIKVIDEIAFQTNLLALNAAVEAARAGEAGKGFAVVAEEVRNLAMRSAEAAKNTSELIEESVKNSKNGVDIAGEVARVLEEIVTGIGKTSELVGEIAAASAEQSQGIDQVNTAVTQIDKVTQSNASNAEESASASEELNAQAEQMNQVVEELAEIIGRTTSAAGSSKSWGKKKPVKKPSNTNDDAFHQIARNSKPQNSAKAAEAVIPFGDDISDGLDGFNS